MGYQSLFYRRRGERDVVGREGKEGRKGGGASVEGREGKRGGNNPTISPLLFADCPLPPFYRNPLSSTDEEEERRTSVDGSQQELSSSSSERKERREGKEGVSVEDREGKVGGKNPSFSSVLSLPSSVEERSGVISRRFMLRVYVGEVHLHEDTTEVISF